MPSREKGKSTERLSMISTRHQSSLTLTLSQVCKSDKPSTWTVASLDGKKHYTVTLDNQICPHQCALCCPDCKICVHIFTCDCADSLIRATICKHEWFFKLKIHTDRYYKPFTYRSCAGVTREPENGEDWFCSCCCKIPRSVSKRCVRNARCQTGLNFGERSKFAVATFLSRGGWTRSRAMAIITD